MEITIRRLSDDDDLEQLTQLLHRAYASLAARGLRYVAAYQDVAKTRERADEGECYVAVIDQQIVGTVVYRRTSDWVDGYFGRTEVASFGQFAVDPQFQSCGIGRQLCQACIDRARETGATELALDTSELAHDLIALYEHWGFHIVDQITWGNVNYRSVIMSMNV